jgi:hypothetical protein
MRQLGAVFLDRPRSSLADAQDKLMQDIKIALFALDWHDTGSI